MFPYGEYSLTEPQDYFLSCILKASPLSILFLRYRITNVGIFSLTPQPQTTWLFWIASYLHQVQPFQVRSLLAADIMPSLPLAPSLSAHPTVAKVPNAEDRKNMKSSGSGPPRKSNPTVEDIIVHRITHIASEYWAPDAEVTTSSSFSLLQKHQN